MLQITDADTGGNATMGVLGNAGTIVYEPLVEFEPTIYCNVNPPQNADAKTTAANVTSPANANVGAAFPVSVSGTVPQQPVVVNTDVSVGLNLPADCTAAGPNPVVVSQNLAVSAATPVGGELQRHVHNSSFHNFTGTVTATVNDPNAADANAANNSMTSAVSTTAILANADLAVTAGTTIERRSGAVSAAEPAGPGLRQRSDAPGECDDPDHRSRRPWSTTARTARPRRSTRSRSSAPRSSRSTLRRPAR